MKFKLDENFGLTALSVFVRRGLDCHTVRDENLTGAVDPEILAAAVSENRVRVLLSFERLNHSLVK